VEGDVASVGVGEGECPSERPSIGAETIMWLAADERIADDRRYL
jgi:hypothetical protein